MAKEEYLKGPYSFSMNRQNKVYLELRDNIINSTVMYCHIYDILLSHRLSLVNSVRGLHEGMNAKRQSSLCEFSHFESLQQVFAFKETEVTGNILDTGYHAKFWKNYFLGIAFKEF